MRAIEYTKSTIERKQIIRHFNSYDQGQGKEHSLHFFNGNFNIYTAAFTNNNEIEGQHSFTIKLF